MAKGQLRLLRRGLNRNQDEAIDELAKFCGKGDEVQQL
jgi:hypothetical protein